MNRKELLTDPDKMAKFVDDYAKDHPEEFAQFSKQMEENMKHCENRELEIAQLPKEDTVWLIVQQPTEKVDGKEQRCLVLVDREGSYLAYHMEEPSKRSLPEQCYSLICLGCLYPLSGKSRRPRLVTFKDPEIARNTKLDLSQLNIRFINPATVEDGVKTDSELLFTRECSCCRRRGQPELFKECSACTGVLYCSKECQKKDWKRKGPLEGHGHKNWCAYIKKYIEKSEELADFPFSFTKETTDKEFHVNKYKNFLERQGVYNMGLWRRECNIDLLTIGPCIFGEIPPDSDHDPYVLPVESTILSETPKTPAPTLSNWLEYYTWRGFKLDSPIAILLHYPLTLYHIVVSMFAQHYKEEWNQIVSSKKMTIHLLGVEKEVEMLIVFKEFGYLMPDIEFDIHMFGKEISSKLDNKEEIYNNIHITIHYQLYHDYTGNKPDIAIGFNSGIAAYQTWGPTILKLRDEKIPTYITDYCQYSCECTRGSIKSVAVYAGPTLINPFRNPVRKICLENNMPWYSNGFIIKLNYEPLNSEVES